MKIADQEILLCNCGGTMPLDAQEIGGLAYRIGLSDSDEAPQIWSMLCRDQIEAVRKAVGAGACIIACTQEIARFREAECEAGADRKSSFVDIRESACWSSEAAAKAPKLMGMLAAASVQGGQAEYFDTRCSGRVLVYGNDQAALDAAERLAQRLDVTLLLEAGDDVAIPARRPCTILCGRVRGLQGSIGAFSVEVEDLAELAPWARSAADRLPSAGDRPMSFDLVLDLSNRMPWFPDPGRRLGYVRADTRRPELVERALFDLSALVGVISRPRYVAYRPSLCAHAASSRTGCTRCIEACPTGALSSAGAVVQVNENICAGCGSCSGVCPTGAIRYAAPDQSITRRKLGALVGAYVAAGGVNPVVLFHSQRRGADMVAALARFGPGLPANVLPLDLAHTTQLGAGEFAIARAFGAVSCIVQLDPEDRHEGAPLRGQIELANALFDEGAATRERVRLFDGSDPDALLDAMTQDFGEPEALREPSLDMIAGSNAVVRAAFACLKAYRYVQLPQGAPFGRVDVDDRCTVCLACARACPTSALEGLGAPPTLFFQEEACVQCGLCVAVCPEKAVTLTPQFDCSASRSGARVLKADEAAECPSCGARFGSRRSIERVIASLRDSGWAQQNEKLAERLRFCESCRVTA